MSWHQNLMWEKVSASPEILIVTQSRRGAEQVMDFPREINSASLRSLREIVARGEGEQIEFKTASNGVHDDTFETVCSFSNHRGGDILLGVNDSGVVVGLSRDSVDLVLAAIRERCSCEGVFSPTVNVQLEVAELWRRQIVRIHVEPNPRRVAYKGVSYIRLGESDYKGVRP